MICEKCKSKISNKQYEYDFFLSYSSFDQSTAEAIYKTLTDSGYKCWFAPISVKPGHDYAEEIINGIDSSKYFLFLTTNNLHKTNHIRRELEYAMNKEKLIIPLKKCNPCKLPDAVNYCLSTCQWIEVQEPIISIVDKLKPLFNTEPETHLNKIIYDLTSYSDNDFSIIDDTPFQFLQDNNLIVKANSYAKGVVLNRYLPEKFKVTVRFNVREFEGVCSQFIIGLYDGYSYKEKGKNIHVCMHPNWTAIKYQDFSLLPKPEFDRYLDTDFDTKIKPDLDYSFEFIREENYITVILNNQIIFNKIEIPNMKTLNYLYITTEVNINNNQKILEGEIEIKKLLIERL